MNIKFSKKEYLALALVVCLVILSAPGLLNLPVEAAQDEKGQTINLTVEETITLTLASSTFYLANLTPGIPVSATTSATVETNSSTGFNLNIKNNSGTSTLALVSDGSIGFPDATPWDHEANGGNGNATTSNNVGANLHFRVVQSGTTAALYNSTWWGPNDNDGPGNAKYAGYPKNTNKKIAQRTDYASGQQTVIYKLRADSPSSQRSGAYTGATTLTAITGT